MKNLRVRIAAVILCANLLVSGYSAAAVRRSCTRLIQQSEAVLTAENRPAEIEALTAQ